MGPTVSRNLSRVVALGALLGVQCADGSFPPAMHQVAVDSSTTLEVVDWGGGGRTIVLLAGLGHTAHVFDELAPLLTDDYRVLGITRRGFGASSQPDSGYDLQTLVEDIRGVMDHLEVDDAVLAGHSLGGDEMTLFARTHPDRVLALVYIEAAYNRVSVRDVLAAYEAPATETAPPTDHDDSSVGAYRSYYTRVNGVEMPLTEIEAMYTWDSNGRRLGSVTPGWIYARILEGLEDPEYSGIGVPALAIYGVDYPVTELFLDYEDRDSLTQRQMLEYLDGSLKASAMSREYFREHMSNGRVVEIEGAGHSLYITHTTETLEAMKSFLAEVL